MSNSITLTVPNMTFTITANSDGTFDLTHAPDHGFDRLSVSAEQLRVEAACMVTELGSHYAPSQSLLDDALGYSIK